MSVYPIYLRGNLLIVSAVHGGRSPPDIRKTQRFIGLWIMATRSFLPIPSSQKKSRRNSPICAMKRGSGKYHSKDSKVTGQVEWGSTAAIFSSRPGRSEERRVGKESR